MNKTIFKYPFKVQDKITIVLPKDAEILTVQTQRDNPCIWALVDPNNKTEERYFEIFGTGHEVYEDMGIERRYINTFQMQSGLVWHLFERIN